MADGSVEKRVPWPAMPSWAGAGALAGAAGIALAVYALCGAFVRYVADDYCLAASLRHYNWFAAQAHWYDTWTGKLPATALTTLALQVGPVSARLMSGILIAGLLLAACLVLRHIAGLDRLSVLALGAVTTYAVMRTAPDVTESAFWLTGECVYLPPMILAPIVAVAIVRRGRARSLRWSVPIGLLALLSAGFSETAAALQVTGFGLLTVVAFLPRISRRLNDFIPGLLGAFSGSLLGAAAIIASPGNAIRQAYYPPHPSVLLTASSALTLACQFTVAFAVNNVDIVVLVALAAGLFGWRYGRAGERSVRPRLGWAHLGWTAWASILVVMCFLPAYWAESSPPPQRTLISACAILVGWIAAAGLWAGFALGSVMRMRELADAETPGSSRRSPPIPQWAMSAIFPALAIVPLVTAGTTLRHVPSLADWSRQADLLQLQLSAVEGSNRDVTISWSSAPTARPLLYKASLMPGRDATGWVNVCIADDYELRTLTVVSP